MKQKIGKFSSMLCAVFAVLIIIGCGGSGSSSGASSGASSSFTNSGNEPVFTDTTEEIYNVEEGSLYVGTFKATDKSKVTYFIDGEDDKYFYINTGNGKLSFRNRPDFEEKATYNLTIIVRDIVGNETSKPIVINIINLNEEAKDKSEPIFTSNDSFIINKNDSIRILTTDMSEVTYTLKGYRSSDFNFDSSTGILSPRELTLSYYSFTIEAKDSHGNISIQQITITIEEEIAINTNTNGRDTSNPIFTSSDSIYVELSTQLDYSLASSILEIQTIDDSPVTYSLQGKDQNSFFFDR